MTDGPADGTRYLTFHLLVGTPGDEHIWCPDCLLPTGLDFPLYSITSEMTGVSLFGHVRACLRCERTGL